MKHGVGHADRHEENRRLVICVGRQKKRAPKSLRLPTILLSKLINNWESKFNSIRELKGGSHMNYR